MQNSQENTLSCYVAPVKWHYESRRRYEAPELPWRYEFNLLRHPIPLSAIEYRIVTFLASRPYHPFTRQQIADAVTTERHPVTEDTLDGHIATLRDRLGMFSDYIQSVPYIGYRFKE